VVIPPIPAPIIATDFLTVIFNKVLILKICNKDFKEMISSHF